MRLSHSTRQQLTLPAPGADAQAASEALQQHIIQQIDANAGWISFARYMELALYAPDLGYYSGGAAKLGKDGDFTTAPEMSALFGATLAQLAASLLAQTSAQVMEFGAGTGRLAFDFLSECQAAGIAVERYFIVELSGELRARQEDLLKNFPQVQWLQQMPDAFCGVVLGNEVLDAMPVHLVVKTERGWREVGVALRNQAEPEHTSAESTIKHGSELIFSDRAMDAQLQSQLLAQIPGADQLPLGYMTELHPVAAGFMRSLAAMLKKGRELIGKGALAILIDYGFPAREYYLDQRTQGTLMCHYRHHAHPDPFYLPGLQDITAHVDFTSMALAAQAGGLELLAYVSQAGFLLEAGIGELLMRTSASDPMAYLPKANALQKLISPAEMGELFKVLVVGAGVELDARLLRHDRSHRL
ncbi:SAM-dependent methyltransferase [Undibacterium sp. 5I1]|uniref:class I SAM-dependent methyltransferase n=1 Tax=unclassified Undibacterium TaxID=2630295 RepID=UPI002AB5C7D7|nr:MULTISPECIES: SAM-dependent methyltransferase [unclassified Undibacterium]MDY7539389.1 SAM-dependent methyltransferase [Undibacterium sp. 5I1]MEB0232976.1 SAM-dependent methyltransferase [Undibacterium sp. 10I3]MEB0258336.1 SAM-dependent methyltransferase [Undibacterium sp. 5I1]